MKSECYFCHIKTVEKLINKFKPQEDQAEDFIFAIHSLLENNKETINPELATYIHRLAKDKLQVDDLYAEEKLAANRLLESDYPYWRSFVNESTDPFAVAAKLAVVGNIIDYGAHSLQGDLVAQIKALNTQALSVDKTAALKEALSVAQSVLYLGDNAGEIVFDKLFIETINHPNLTFVTRGAPVINDVTVEDALALGFGDICKVIDNGYDAPSTLLDFCSEDFLYAYNHADLIISKGQGNFEGLMHENHPNTYFMLIAKCRPMAEMLGVKKNNMVITKL